MKFFNAFMLSKEEAKQQEEYLQKKDEILSNTPTEENKARAQKCYDANPEKNTVSIII